MRSPNRKRRCNLRGTVEALECRFLLDGQGLFSSPEKILVRGGLSVQLADFDNDDDLDVFIAMRNNASSESKSRVYQNDGLGNFSAAGIPFGPADPNSVEVADLDGDGDLDIALVGARDGLRIFWNQGAFQFVNTSGILDSNGSPSGAVIAADFDTDGDVDLIAHMSPQGSRLYRNGGDGNFTTEAIPNYAGIGSFADLDGDRDVDILLDGGWLRNNAGKFDDIAYFGVRSPSSVADFDGDGDVDVYASSNNSTGFGGLVFLNDGNANFTSTDQLITTHPFFEWFYDSAVGDVDLDGDVDLLVAHDFDPTIDGDTGLSIWSNDGSGRFRHEAGPIDSPQSIRLGDIDGDGDLDVVSTTGGSLSISRNRTITTVQLPNSGSFEILREQNDVVIRTVNGVEIFREPAVGIKTLRIRGTAGDERIDASSLTGIGLVLDGGDGNDTLIGGAGGDSLDGGNGNDSVLGQSGDDSLVGGDGLDTLLGGAGRDSLVGGGGNDRINGQSGADTITGGLGDDCLVGGDGIDCLAESGDVNFTLRPTTLRGLGNDRLTLFEKAMLTGGDGANVLDASTSNMLVTLIGGAGDDLLRGGSRSDSLDGGDGNDTLIGNDGHDSLTGGTNDDLLIGGNGNDLLNGDTGSDTLTGGNGSDKLLGGADSDTLLGGLGNDTLNGGDGTDRIAGGNGRHRAINPADVFVDSVSEIDEAMTVFAKWLTGV